MLRGCGPRAVLISGGAGRLCLCIAISQREGEVAGCALPGVAIRHCNYLLVQKEHFAACNVQ